MEWEYTQERPYKKDVISGSMRMYLHVIRRLVEPGQCGGANSGMEYESPRHERWVDADDPWIVIRKMAQGM